MEPKILVAAPTSKHKDYILNEYVTLLKNLSFKNYEIYIVDNSPAPRFELWDSLNIPSAWIDPRNKSSFQFIWESQNQIRNYFLDGDYTHLVMIETDLLPPAGIIEHMLAFDKDVVAMPYFIYKGEESILMDQEIADFWTGGETRNYTMEESFRRFDGKLQQGFSMGFGCVMFKRGVIAGLPFRYISDEMVRNSADGGAHPDSFWYADAYMNSLKVYRDTSMLINHYNQDWNTIAGTN